MPMPSREPGARKLRRMGASIKRRERVKNRLLSHAQKQKDARDGEINYLGMKKIRDLFLRAGVLILPFEDTEVKALLQQAKAEYDETGVISTDIAVRLGAGGYAVEKLTQLWDLMKTCEVDEDALAEAARENAQRMPEVTFVEDTGPINRF